MSSERSGAPLPEGEECPFCKRGADDPQVGCVHRWHDEAKKRPFPHVVFMGRNPETGGIAWVDVPSAMTSGWEIRSYALDGTGKKPLPEAPRCGGDGEVLVTEPDGQSPERTFRQACPGCPDCKPEAGSVDGEECPECGRSRCPWHMPDIEALERAAEPVEALGELGIEPWSRFLLNLRHQGWEIRRTPASEQSHTEEGKR